MIAGQQSSHWKVHHLVLPYTSKLCRLAVEGIATEGDRNHPLARVYPFFWPDCLPRSSMFYSLYLSIPTAVQINEDSLSLPDWFLRTPWPFCCGMKQQEGNSTNKSRAWWSQHKHSGNHPSLPRINKRKATSDPGTFWHAGSGGAAASGSPQSSLPCLSLWHYHAGVQSENPEPCWIFYITFTLLVARVCLLYLLFNVSTAEQLTVPAPQASQFTCLWWQGPRN